MNQWWWELTRASGIVATALAVGSLVFGAFFSARNTGVRRPAAWWLDLHNYLGGLALVFTGVHVLASLLDPDSGIGIVQVLVPGTWAAASWALTWGVLATDSFVIAVFHLLAPPAVLPAHLAAGAPHLRRRSGPGRGVRRLRRGAAGDRRIHPGISREVGRQRLSGGGHAGSPARRTSLTRGLPGGVDEVGLREHP
jgi:hypothetical protein